MRKRLVALVFLLIIVPLGWMFSAVTVAAGLVAGAAVALWSWLKNPVAIRTVFYGGLLVVATVLYFISPHSVVGGAVATCEELPAVPFLREAEVVRDAAPLTPQAAYLQEVRRKSAELLSQADLIARAHQLLPEVRVVVRSFAERDSAQAASLASAANAFEASLREQNMASDEAIQVRRRELDQALGEFRVAVEAEGDAVDIEARRSQFARIVLDRSFDALFTSMTTLTRVTDDVVRQHGGLKMTTAYEVVVEPAAVRYDERVDLTLGTGHFISVDLREFAQQAALAGPGTQITVGGDGLGPQSYAPEELNAPLGLSTRPKSIWVLVRTRAQPAAVPACPGVTLLPFQRVRLAWPIPNDLTVRGATQLELSNSQVPFSLQIKKSEAQVSQVLLPQYALFMQKPVRLAAAGITRVDQSVYDRFTPSDDAVKVGTFATTIELLPDSRMIRNAEVYEGRALFFPVNWVLALVYLTIVAALGDFVLHRERKPAPANL